MNHCECGCGNFPKSLGAKFCRGHHLKKDAKIPIIRPRKNFNICRICNISFYRRGKISTLCSRKCSGIAYTLRFDSTITECIVCNKRLIIPNNKKFQGIKHCSRECRNIGIDKGCEDGIGSWETIREFTYRKRGYKCEECGYDKHPRILVVHHIDGKHDFNNLPSNLKIVCPTCHAEAHLKLNPDRIKRIPHWRG